ncbi:MAG TPA: GTPase ObgE [Candidatus Paceibacterota bacterium]
MAFVDHVTIKVKAGDGGDGVVRWRREKFKPMSGPGGGDGGKGGDVYIEAIGDLSYLEHYRNIKELEAEKGGNGDNFGMHGKTGEDLVIKLPRGTLVKNISTGESYDLIEVGERFQILTGGYGGFGNEHFKRSNNVTPKESTPGRKGEEGLISFELRIIADVGIIGFPNAGKTSFLNAVTQAQGKVANYPFTTIEPNLGVYFEYIFADIPGLIEGASEGKGLGHKFLQHVRRTRVLVHFIEARESVEELVAAYKAIRDELGAFDSALLQKDEIVVMSKIDNLEGDITPLVEGLSKAIGKEVHSVSLYDDASTKKLVENIVGELKKE